MYGTIDIFWSSLFCSKDDSPKLIDGMFCNNFPSKIKDEQWKIFVVSLCLRIFNSTFYNTHKQKAHLIFQEMQSCVHKRIPQGAPVKAIRELLFCFIKVENFFDYFLISIFYYKTPPTENTPPPSTNYKLFIFPTPNKRTLKSILWKRRRHFLLSVLKSIRWARLKHLFLFSSSSPP